MIKRVFLLFVFQSFFTFSQGLEDQIYKDLDAFVANKNANSLKKIEAQERQYTQKIITKEEYLALVILQCNKAFYLKENRQIREAIISYENAWDNFSNKNLSNYNIIEFCLKPLGNLYIKTKDYTNAENTLRQYVYLAKKKQDKLQEIAGIINLCILYQTLNKHQLVLSIVAENLDSVKNNAQKETLKKLKKISLIGLKKYIEEVSETSLQYRIAIESKEYEKAFYFLKKLQKESIKEELSTREKAKGIFEEAQLLYLLNKRDASKKLLQKALHILLPNLKENEVLKEEMLYAENTFIDIFDLNAHLQNNLEEALKSYNFSFYVADLLVEQMTSQEAKILNTSENRKRSEACIKLLFEDYKNTKKSSLIETALFYAEKNKSNLLRERSQRKVLREKYPSGSLLLQEMELFNKQSVLTNSLVKEQVSEKNRTKIYELSKELNATSIALKRIQVAIRKKYKTKHKDAFLLAEIQQKLKEKKATLVTYFYGDFEIYQFIISENTSAFHQLENRENTTREILKYTRFFEDVSKINSNINAFTEQAFSIYKVLNLSKVLKTKNLVIVPDGFLNFLPFEALLTAKTTSSNFSKMPFLVTKQTVIYSLSVQLFTRTFKEGFTKKVLGVFPVFSNTNRELKYSVDEAKYIQETMSTKLLMEDQAIKSKFIKEASNYGILHLSTHATGGRFMAPASISFFDEELTIKDLYALSLEANLVVLSACETGVGKLYKGEGVMNLAQGFTYAGVEKVLFSLWKINDRSTTEVMRLFYDNLDKFSSVSYANNRSKTAYLSNENISNAKKSPYYWGAFVYYGNIEAPEIQSKLYLYIMGLVSLIIISLALLYRNKLVLLSNRKENKNDR